MIAPATAAARSSPLFKLFVHIRAASKTCKLLSSEQHNDRPGSPSPACAARAHALLPCSPLGCAPTPVSLTVRMVTLCHPPGFRLYSRDPQSWRARFRHPHWAARRNRALRETHADRLQLYTKRVDTTRSPLCGDSNGGLRLQHTLAGSELGRPRLGRNASSLKVNLDGVGAAHTTGSWQSCERS